MHNVQKVVCGVKTLFSTDVSFFLYLSLSMYATFTPLEFKAKTERKRHVIPCKSATKSNCSCLREKTGEVSFDSGIFFFTSPPNETLDGTCVNNAAILGRLNTTTWCWGKSSQRTKHWDCHCHISQCRKRMTRIFAIIKRVWLFLSV